MVHLLMRFLVLAESGAVDWSKPVISSTNSSTPKLQPLRALLAWDSAALKA